MLPFALMIPEASAVEDFITRQAYDNLVKSGAINDIPVMTKTIISNPVLEEALLTYYSNNKLGGSYTCGETCMKGKCYTPNCACSWPICKKNSLDASTTAEASAVEDFITRQAYDNLVKSGAINDIPVMTKTIISNPVLEEALLTYYSNNKLGGSYTCGETCMKGKCYTPNCACSWPICKKNSLDASTTADEEAVFAAAFARKARAGLNAN